MIHSRCVELVPNGSSLFNGSSSPPKVKLIIQFFDQNIVDSKRFDVKVNMNIVNVTHTRSNMFFSNYRRAIDSNLIEIDTASEDYVNSASRNNTLNVYYQFDHRRHDYYDSYSNSPEIAWSSLNTYVFDCSLAFDYIDKISTSSAPKMTQMMPSMRVINSKLIASLTEDDKFSDFTFIVRDKEFKVHKCLLARVSHVFETMFTCGLDETKDNSAKVDCKPEIFNHMLDFIYKNVWPETDMPSISMELYELAHFYHVVPLMKICLSFILQKKIDSSNALELYEFASTYEIEKLLETSWEFIRM